MTFDGSRPTGPHRTSNGGDGERRGGGDNRANLALRAVEVPKMEKREELSERDHRAALRNPMRRSEGGRDQPSGI